MDGKRNKLRRVNMTGLDWELVGDLFLAACIFGGGIIFIFANASYRPPDK